MAKPRSRYARRVDAKARYDRGIAVTRYVAGGGAMMVSGMALATGAVPIGAVTGTAAVGFMGAGASAQRRSQRGFVRARALDDVSRRTSPRLSGAQGRNALRGSAGTDILTTRGMPNVDALAYTANVASTLTGSQMARDMRKSSRSAVRVNAEAAYQAKFGYAPPAGLSPGAMRRWTESGFRFGPGRSGDPAYEKAVTTAKGRTKPAIDQVVDDVKPIASAQKTRAARKAVQVAPAQPSGMAKAGAAFAKFNPVMMATAATAFASSAYSQTRAAGGSQAASVGAGAVAAAPLAAAAVAPTIIGRAAPKLAAGLSKAALPLLALSTAIAAARGGIKAAQEGKGIGGIVGGAAMGAADSLTFGLASKGSDQVAAVARAYLNDSAEARAHAAPARAAAAASGRPAPTMKSSDGMTAGYTRIDPRTGSIVRVESYKTPS